MEERIIAVLGRNFTGGVVTLDHDQAGRKIGGVLVWDGFAGMNFLRRQNTLFRVLRRELGSEALVVSHIFTYTTNEYEQMMIAA